MTKTGVTIYGEYVSRNELRIRLNRQLDVLASSQNPQEFKRGYREALLVVRHWLDDGPQAITTH